MGPISGAAKVFICRMATDPQIIIIVPYFLKLDHFALNYHSRKSQLKVLSHAFQ
jgi:hypothetical protein